MIEYNKLVRDKIPEIITQGGMKAITHIADEKEYEEALYQKLGEEVKEFQEKPSAEELADILEVVYAICDWKKIDRDELEKLRQEKAEKRGGFSKRIILEKTE